ncbi:hypothetical protein Y1Q_0024581 [Alligator mississippiensis]|uniref:Uncharacterized protein n=1 Tax=Alligator mississippiensis TaxID=8496 RepID=A0A151NB32_ALLMI|nr:hypothetical protein Y1Q_0024581 [Alligator mississippiensis]
MAIIKLATHTSLCFIGNRFSMAPCMAGVAIHEVLTGKRLDPKEHSIQPDSVARWYTASYELKLSTD